MKRLLILFILLSKALLSQTHNEMIWNFVDENIGFKVGDGVCLTLVEKAYSQFTDAKLTKKATRTTAHYYFGEEVQEPIKGDVVIFLSKDTIANIESAHIGVVYDKGIVAHQNYDTHDLKYSEVVLTLINEVIISSKSEVVTIKYYRPF